MANSVIIGYGEIGKAIHRIFQDADIVEVDTPVYESKYEVMHICLPHSHKFGIIVRDYQSRFSPKHTIIYSTVPIGTTKQIPGAVHSPVEGRHPDLELSIRTTTRWLGADDETEFLFFSNLFAERFIKVRRLTDSRFTEFLKLRSTAKYGINLIWADYELNVADELGMDYRFVKEFDKDYNRLYHELGEHWAKRYILVPPGGKIGGHCVVPNAKLLNEQYPNEWLEKLANYGV